ncbi:MAG: GNAT family N-acetyltransferase [Neisseria sp.]|nr:GNAT family N-acetyltransferase [Neisseria sp.]
MMNAHPLESLFTPQHIIVVGASERPGSLGESVLTALLHAPFQGRITLVNLRHKNVGGLKAWPNINRITEPADIALILTPPPSYENLFKACHKKQIPHIVLVQDWENQSEEALAQTQTALQKSRRLGLNITACTPAAIQMPASGLNTGIYPLYPTVGNVAVISWHAAASAGVTSILHRAKLGISRHISLHPRLGNTCSAALLDCFEQDPATRLVVLEYNPQEPLRDLFSAIRHISRQKSVILHCTHHTDIEEQAVLRHLSRYCSFIPTFTPDELLAAVHALSCGKKDAKKLHVIANTPCDWLHAQAENMGITLQMAARHPRPSENHNGYIGSNPGTLHYRSLADQNLQSSHSEALLAIVVPTAGRNEADITHSLRQLQQQHHKPLFISSPLSDGLLQFRNTQQALRAYYYLHHNHELKRLRIETAKPLPAYLKTPDPASVKTHLHDNAALLQVLHLAEPHNPHLNPDMTLHFHRHPRYGAVLSAHHPARNMALLPPFNTLQADRLIQQFNLKRQQKTVYQLLHSLNTVVTDIPQIASLSINFAIPSADIDTTPTDTETTTANIRAAYPAADAPAFTLKNGQTATIRPLKPEDAEAEQRFVQNLSDKSRQSRFMAHIKELSQSTLASFCNLDYHREGAFAAVADDGTLLGVSRFSCAQYPASCEFGISVAENMHGQGLALRLMQEIIILSRRQGYASMTAEIFKTNSAMLKLAEKLGFAISPSLHDNELCEAVLDLSGQTNNNKRKTGQ